MPSATQLYSTGRWLNASDLANNPNIGLNKRVPAIVHHAEPELIGQGGDQKTMLMLDLVSKQGQAWPKKLPLNKTNTMAMVAAYGDNYEEWPGRQIEIWAENVMFSGKMVPGLKLSASNGAAQAAAPAIPGTAQAQPPSPPPSAAAVAGMPQAAAPTWNAPRNQGTPIEDDAIPF